MFLLIWQERSVDKMYGEELKGVIEEYLRDSRAEYAVMIDGDWATC